MSVTLDIHRRALWAVVTRANRERGTQSLWAWVSDHCGLGSTVARAVCRDLGFDPDSGAVDRERGWEEVD